MTKKINLKTIYSDDNVVLKISKNPPSYYLWVRPAATLLPVDENEKFLLMHEYKAVTKKWVWGFPGGIVEPSESASYAAKRECEEELGIKIKTTKKITEVKTNFPETSVTYFLGFDLQKSKGKGWEKIGKVEKVSFDKLLELTMDGKISDPRTVVAILHLKKLITNRKITLK